jgi:hypothetical protein
MSSGLLSFCVESICGKKKDDDDDDDNDYDDSDSVSDTSSVSETSSVTSDNNGRNSGQFQLSSLMPSLSSLRMSSSSGLKDGKEKDEEEEEEDNVTTPAKKSWFGSISSRLSFGSSKKAEDTSSANMEHTRVRLDSHEEMIEGTSTMVDTNPDYDDVYASNVGEISALSTSTTTPSTPSDQDNMNTDATAQNNNGEQIGLEDVEYKDFSRKNLSSYGDAGTIVRKSGRSFFINDVQKDERKPSRRLGRAPPIHIEKEEVEIHYAENPIFQLPVPVKGSGEYDYLDAIIDENSGDKRQPDTIKLEASEPIYDKGRLPGTLSMAKRRASHAYVQNLHYSSAAKKKTPEEGVEERKGNNDSPVTNGNNNDTVARPKGRRTSVALENMSKQSFISSRLNEKRSK